MNFETWEKENKESISNIMKKTKQAKNDQYETTSRLFENLHLKKQDKDKISKKALNVSRRLMSARLHQCNSRRCESSNIRTPETDLNKQYQKLLSMKQ
jgi:hypothetical protein